MLAQWTMGVILAAEASGGIKLPTNVNRTPPQVAFNPLNFLVLCHSYTLRRIWENYEKSASRLAVSLDLYVYTGKNRNIIETQSRFWYYEPCTNGS